MNTQNLRVAQWLPTTTPLANQSIRVATVADPPTTQYADPVGSPGPPGPQGAQGVQGAPGPTGPTGVAGPTGPANSLTIGTVTTGAPGSPANAAITGTPPSQTLNLTIPEGDVGLTGAQGPAGPQGPTGTTGAIGPANDLTIGTVTTGAPGSPAGATITGAPPAQQLNLAIPRGDVGPTGDVGPAGPPNSLDIGTVTTGAAGSAADATITGTAPAQTLSLTIPRGDTGAQGIQGTAGTPGAPGTPGVNTVFTSVANGLVPASGGGTANFLRADGTFVAPPSGGTPGGATTQVQFNNAGAFGASANLTWSDSGTLGGPQLTIGSAAVGIVSTPPGAAMAVQPAPATGSGNGGSLNLTAGAGATSGNGGTAQLSGGQAGASGSGGGAGLYGAPGVGGGLITLQAGNASGAGVGANVSISAGLTTSGTVGGALVVRTGVTVITERFRIMGNGAWSIGSAGTEVGTTGQVLTSNGTGTPPTWQAAGGGTPGGSTTQVQFNNAGAFAGDADFTWDLTNNTMVVGSTAFPATIRGTGGLFFTTPSNASASAAGISLTAGQTTFASGQAGIISITAGLANAANATAGAVNITGGSKTSNGAGGAAGDVTITGGPNNNSAASNSTVTITGGSGGNSGSGAGDIVIRAGTNTGGGAGGYIALSTSGTTNTLTERLRILANGAWSVGTAGTATGGAGQVLTSNGSGSAPTWQSSYLNPPTDVWYTSSDGKSRLQYVANGPTYIGTGSSPGAYDGPAIVVMRDSLGADRFAFNSGSDGGAYLNVTTGSGGFFTIGVNNSVGAWLGTLQISTNLNVFVGGAQRMQLQSTGALRLHAYGAGTLVTDASGNITASSDAAIKRNVRDFHRGLAAVRALRPILHGYTKASRLDQRRDDYVSFIADDVRDAIPEAVGRGGDGLLTLSDRAILATVVRAIQELADRQEQS